MRHGRLSFETCRIQWCRVSGAWCNIYWWFGGRLGVESGDVPVLVQECEVQMQYHNVVDLLDATDVLGKDQMQTRGTWGEYGEWRRGREGVSLLHRKFVFSNFNSFLLASLTPFNRQNRKSGPPIRHGPRCYWSIEFKWPKLLPRTPTQKDGVPLEWMCWAGSEDPSRNNGIDRFLPRIIVCM